MLRLLGPFENNGSRCVMVGHCRSLQRLLVNFVAEKVRERDNTYQAPKDGMFAFIANDRGVSRVVRCPVEVVGSGDCRRRWA